MSHLFSLILCRLLVSGFETLIGVSGGMSLEVRSESFFILSSLHLFSKLITFLFVRSAQVCCLCLIRIWSLSLTTWSSFEGEDSSYSWGYVLTFLLILRTAFEGSLTLSFFNSQSNLLFANYKSSRLVLETSSVRESDIWFSVVLRLER